MVSIHSSPNDQMLWAIDSKWNVHVRVGITDEMPVGTDWEHVPGKSQCISSLFLPFSQWFCFVLVFSLLLFKLDSNLFFFFFLIKIIF